MKWVRTHACLGCGSPYSEAHHCRVFETIGVGLKVGDDQCLPLCHTCHMELHAYGDESLWWSMKGVDPGVEIEKLRSAYGTNQTEDNGEG